MINDALSLVQDGSLIRAGMKSILVHINEINMSMGHRQFDLQNVSIKRRGPANRLEGGKCFANQYHATLKAVISGATMENMIPWQAP